MRRNAGAPKDNTYRRNLKTPTRRVSVHERIPAPAGLSRRACSCRYLKIIKAPSPKPRAPPEAKVSPSTTLAAAVDPVAVMSEFARPD